MRWFPFYPQVYCTTTFYPCRDFGKILKLHIKLLGTHNMVKTSSFVSPYWTVLLECLIYLVLEGGHKSTKIGLAMGVKIEGDAAKSGKITHLLVLMRLRISQKIGLIDLKNQTWSKKGNGYKICTKSVRDYCVMSLLIYTLSIY